MRLKMIDGDNLVLRYAGGMGHTVVVTEPGDQGKRRVCVESCDLDRCLREARPDQAVYTRARGRGWKRVK